MVDTYIIVSAIIAILSIALVVGYQTGTLDPVIEKIGIMLFKAKAKAEEKKMEAEGMREGEDFLASMFPFPPTIVIPALFSSFVLERFK
jgi:hypothetical protein